MTLKIINQGTHKDISWVEVEGILSENKIDPETKNYSGSTVIIKSYSSKDRDIFQNSIIEKSELNQEIFPYPQYAYLDAKKIFTGKRIAYYHEKYSIIDIDEYIKKHFKISDSIDVRFEAIEYSGKLHAYATTFKNGAIKTIKKKMDPTIPFEESVPSIVKYFEKNCPKVDEKNSKKISCSIFLSNIISNYFSETAYDAMRNWAESPVKTDHFWGLLKKELRITAPMLSEKSQISNIKLFMTHDEKVVKSEINTFHHVNIIDDKTGTNITIRENLPDAVLIALKDKPIENLIDIPFLRGHKIKSCKRQDKYIIVRLYQALEEIPVKNSSNIDDIKQIKMALMSYFDDPEGRKIEKGITCINQNAVHIMRKFNPGQVLAIMSSLYHDKFIDLEPYGCPGWKLSYDHKEISASESPTISMKTIVQELFQA